MDASGWFAVISGLAALVTAVWAGVQGTAAKRQASAAEHQTELSKKQLEEMRRANEIAEKTLAEERNALKLRLDIDVKFVPDGGGGATPLWIVAVIENNCRTAANVQKIYIY